MQRMHSLCLFLILLSHCIAITQQQCLNTTTVNGGSYSFALALVNDLSNPLGPQEACYYSCGAEIVTHSANTGFMAELTWMDKAAQDLAASGFLQRGKAYILNQLGLSEEEGGNGIGCVLVARGRKLSNYPIKHKVCSNAKVALCGLNGKPKMPSQTLPRWNQKTTKPTPTVSFVQKSTKLQPKSAATNKRRPAPKATKRPKTTNLLSNGGTSKTTLAKVPSTTALITATAPTKTSTRVANDSSWSNRHRSQNKSQSSTTSTTTKTPTPNKTTKKTTPATFNVSSSSSSSYSSSSSDSNLTPSKTDSIANNNSNPPATALADDGVIVIDPDIIAQFQVDNINYQVVAIPSSYGDANSNETDMSLVCRKRRTKISDMTPVEYDAIARKLKAEVASDSKLVIGSWNHNTNTFSGDHCLIMQVDYGIYPGLCSGAAGVLCQT